MSVIILINYIFVNGFLLLMGLFQLYFEPENTFFTLLARNYALLHFIDYSTRHKPSIHAAALPIEAYKYEFHVNVITATAVETLTHLFIVDTAGPQSLSADIIYFIPVSFIFELIFELFYYFTHRLLHSRHFYKYIHKKHHKFPHPIAITSFYQAPLDLLITNSVPTNLALVLFPYVSARQFVFITVYKKFIEISGHTGKLAQPTSAFLPHLLQLELYTEHHDLHHSRNNCNYGNQLSIWDHLFKTYQQPKITSV
jgi:sterol desaturase/sphingolipid hydroxylase (fatty acid hydroxylase superfamily)